MPSLKRIGTIAAYLLLGVIGTTATGLVLLYALEPLQAVIYNAVYLQMGPSEAFITAIITHFLVTSVIALSVSMLVGDYLSDRLAHRAALAKGTAAMLGLVLVFFLVPVTGLTAVLTALFLLPGAFVVVILLLRFRYGARSGGVPAFFGGIPLIIVLFFLFAMAGWGWGYVITAEEVPASAVDGSAAADFSTVPELRDDLVATDCSTDTNGRRVCRLRQHEIQSHTEESRDYEARAARFMARHGVRCPYQTTQSGQSESFIATYNGSYYRVTCSRYGDYVNSGLELEETIRTPPKSSPPQSNRFDTATV